MSTRNCAPSTSSPSAGTMSESCTNNRALVTPVFLKHKISFSVDSLLSSCTNTNRNSQTRQLLEGETEGLILNNKPLLKSDQSTLTQPLSPVVGSLTSQADLVDASTNGNVTKQCDAECNDDLEDEELDVDDEECDVGRRKRSYDNQLQYFDTRINDDSSGTRTSQSPSADRDAEDGSPPVMLKPFPHPGVALGGLHQPAGVTGPPCWGFPPGLASQLAWMPVYRPSSPVSEYHQTS